MMSTITDHSKYICFSLLLFCVFWDYSNSQQKDKQYTENLIAKLQKWNQTFAYPRLVLLLGLAKSIY